jgi:hypothetical protein
MEAGADLGGESVEVGVGGLAPQSEGVVSRDAGGGGDLGADSGERGGRGGHRIILVCWFGGAKN